MKMLLSCLVLLATPLLLILILVLLLYLYANPHF